MDSALIRSGVWTISALATLIRMAQGESNEKSEQLKRFEVAWVRAQAIMMICASLNEDTRSERDVLESRQVMVQRNGTSMVQRCCAIEPEPTITTRFETRESTCSGVVERQLIRRSSESVSASACSAHISPKHPLLQHHTILRARSSRISGTNSSTPVMGNCTNRIDRHSNRILRSSDDVSPSRADGSHRSAVVVGVAQA